jgi:nucleotide-binding universal stress UspA family protein
LVPHIYHGSHQSTMFNKILVAIDGSDPSLHALEIATQIALTHDSELTILTVAPYPPPTLTEDAMPNYLPQYQDDLRESYKKMLQKTNKKLKEKHPTLKTTPIVMEGKPSTTIVKAARAREAELIVIGSRGTSGIIDWMLGTVSQQIANSCTAPVLIVKDQKYCQK